MSDGKPDKSLIINKNRQKVAVMVLAEVDDEGIFHLDPGFFKVVSQATMYRFLDELKKSNRAVKVGDGRYMIPLGPPKLERYLPIRRAARGVENLYEQLDEVIDEFEFFLEKEVAECLACPDNETCFSSQAGTFACKTLRCAPFSNETGICSLIDPKIIGEDHIPFSNDNPECKVAQDRQGIVEMDRQSSEKDRRNAAKGLLKRKLDESSVDPDSGEKKTKWKEQVEVEECFMAEWRREFGAEAVGEPWTKKHRTFVRNMINSYGLELTKKAIHVYISRWKEIMESAKFKGMPTLRVMYALRATVFGLAQGLPVMMNRKAQRNADQYDAESGARGPKVGW